MKIRLVSAPAALALAFTLAACGPDEPAGFDDGTEQADEQKAADEDPVEPEEQGSSGQASGAGVEQIDPSDVLVEQEYTWPGTDITTTYGVHSLTVDGEVMTLRVVVTPDVPGSDNDVVSLYAANAETSMRPVLIDRENLTEYSRIGSGQGWTADSTGTRATNGEPMVWWGVYSAPQDDIDTVDIRLFDSMPEFTDVPITR